jgi:hypothetical protein
MKRPLDVVRGDDGWLKERLEQAGGQVRAPRGFSQRVMSAVYREALAGTPRGEPAAPPSSPRVSRLYRRLALSFMLTGAVLAVSLLVPRGAYSTLIGSAAGTALGAGPTTAVQSALVGAADAVQGALGERLIGGNQQ